MQIEPIRKELALLFLHQPDRFSVSKSPDLDGEKNNPFFLLFFTQQGLRLVCEHHKDEKEKSERNGHIDTLAVETNSRSLIGTLAASCYIKGNQCPLRSRNGMCENHFSLCLWVTAYLH